jgi:hypothetical protein
MNHEINIKVAWEVYGGKHPRRYKGKKFCSCGTVLSSYNPSDKCSVCSQALFREFIQGNKPMTAEDRAIMETKKFPKLNRRTQIPVSTPMFISY